MPLYWTIDSRQKLVAIACEGDVTLADLVEYLDVVEGASALAYPKLFDGTAFQTSMTASDMLEIRAPSAGEALDRNLCEAAWRIERNPIS
jgi:hypothetical protein